MFCAMRKSAMIGRQSGGSIPQNHLRIQMIRIAENRVPSGEYQAWVIADRMPAMFLIRDFIYLVFSLVSSPYWIYRLIATGKWRTDWAARFGRGNRDSPQDRPTVLIHGVSVGEVNAVRLLVETLEQRHGDRLRIVICTTTDTGFARATSLYGDRHQIERYPLDFSWSVRRFLNRIRPDVVALVELEVWPTFVAACGRRGIPVAVINGRLSARSYKRYRLIRALIASSFDKLAAVAVQDEAYADRFVGMGARKDLVRVTGTMKWDTAQIADQVDGAQTLAKELGIDESIPLVVAGSTGPNEERMLADALADLLQSDSIQLLLAPRKPERFNEAAADLPSPIRRTEHPQGTVRDIDGNRIFLLDTLGELRKAYALADVVIVGRSFCPLHGSDMMEPIALGKPTIIGPNVSDFQQMMDALLTGDGIIQLSSVDQLRESILRLLDPTESKNLAERGRAVIREQQGATERHAALIDALLIERASTQPR